MNNPADPVWSVNILLSLMIVIVTLTIIFILKTANEEWFISQLTQTTKTMKIDVPLRVIGSVLVVAAYAVIVYSNVTLGVSMSLLGDTLALPFFIRTKAWDVVLMISFLSCVSISKLAHAFTVGA